MGGLGTCSLPHYPALAVVTIDVGLINVCNVYEFFLIKAFVIFVNNYYFNKLHMKCRKANNLLFGNEFC